MSSNEAMAVIVPVKSGIVAAAEYGERALHRCGIPKKYAIPMKFSWELVHQGGVEAVAGLLRKSGDTLLNSETAAR